jgi:drug/metabolite transporter (DMT)-like permease
MPTILAGLAAMLLYSGSFVATRHAIAAGLGPLDIMMLRYLLGGLACAAVLARIGLGGLSWPRIAALTALGGLPYYAMQVLGVGWSSAGHAAVLNPGGTVVFATLLGWLALGDRPGRGALAALPLLLGGLVLIAGAGFGGGTWAGDALLVASGLQWALYGTLLRSWGVSGLRSACMISAFSLPYVPLHFAIFGWGGLAVAPQEAVFQALYQGLGVGLLANALYSHCYAVMGPSRASIFPPLVPVLGTLLAALVLAEAPGPAQYLGMTLVVGGMLLAGLWRRPAW